MAKGTPVPVIPPERLADETEIPKTEQQSEALLGEEPEQLPGVVREVTEVAPLLGADHESEAPLVELIKREVAREAGIMRLYLMAEMQTMANELTAPPPPETPGISAELVGGIFNCPKCGLRLMGPGLTGMKGGLYEHTFDASPKLSGQQCEFKGRKFSVPVVFLKLVEPKPHLTPKTE